MSALQSIKHQPQALSFLSAGSCHGSFSLLSLMLLSDHLLLPVTGKDTGKQTSGPYIVPGRYSRAHIYTVSCRATDIRERWLI